MNHDYFDLSRFIDSEHVDMFLAYDDKAFLWFHALEFQRI